MGAHHSIIVAVIIAAIAIAALIAYTLTSSEFLSLDYFDAAGKYIHRL